jgi:GTP-binding protein
MSNPNFIDYVKMYCKSGHGGAGSAHLRREKFIPKGGPDGGDGGRGGHIIVKGSRNKWTLLHLKYTKHVKAGKGGEGGPQRSSGAMGKDRILEVPLGAVMKDADTGVVICEVTREGETHIVLRGGRGGLGNDHFKTSTNQTPRYAQPGEEGIEKAIIIELKVLADVGLVGFPNAGKSTLLSVLSAAKPKIADYPFTTLTPNLGMIAYRDDQSFVMADIPGIIEDAHEGKGLGTRFLRHIERNALLLFMVPADTDREISREYDILLNELQQYNPELLDKERILVISKSDLLDEELKQEIQATLPETVTTLFISAIANTGLTPLKDTIWQKLQQ